MTLNNANLAFSSDWIIDQLVTQGTSTITAGNGLNNFTLATYNVANPPVVEVYYKQSGGSYWHQVNQPNATTPGGNDSSLLVAWISSPTSLKVQIDNGGGNITLTVRYFIWSDNINK